MPENRKRDKCEKIIYFYHLFYTCAVTHFITESLYYTHILSVAQYANTQLYHHIMNHFIIPFSLHLTLKAPENSYLTVFFLLSFILGKFKCSFLLLQTTKTVTTTTNGFTLKHLEQLRCVSMDDTLGPLSKSSNYYRIKYLCSEKRFVVCVCPSPIINKESESILISCEGKTV